LFGLDRPLPRHLIFKDEEGAKIADLTSGGMVIYDAPATFTATVPAHRQSVLIVPIALGSTILRLYLLPLPDRQPIVKSQTVSVRFGLVAVSAGMFSIISKPLISITSPGPSMTLSVTSGRIGD
jgi:quinol-cytochrome oxidoreductase complex cytochrome b subunit